eukprot:jgi/Astpho2/3083/fgenesh1_pm.00051_%23_32_t
MGTPLPDLNAGPLPLGQIRSAKQPMRGKKILVLDPKITGFLGLLAEVPLLKEHGVEQLLYLQGEALEGIDVRSIIYLVRSTMQNAQLIAQQVKATNRAGMALEYAAYFMPRRSLVCEEVLEREGVKGDIQVAEYPLNFIPFDSDVLSLEMEAAFKDLVVDGDPSSLYYTARGLMRLQQLYGTIGRVTGKGPSAVGVRDLVLRMRREMGSKAPPVGGSRIDQLVLVDRVVDLISPMCTQLTYEGLIDETLHIKNGTVTTETAAAPGQRPQRMPLNSADRTFRQLRDLSFRGATIKLGEWARAAQQGRKESQRAEVTLSELKDYMVHLRSMPNISRHASLAEMVKRFMVQPTFVARVHAEQDLLSGAGPEACCDFIEDLMFQEEEPAAVLRLICLVSLTQNGLPKKQFDRLRLEFLRTYGHPHILTLSALQDAGMLKLQQGSRAALPVLRKAFRLFVEQVDEVDPNDVAYVHACYAPLSIRLVDTGPSATAAEEALKLLPGAYFDIQQGINEHGLPVDNPVDTKSSTHKKQGRRTVVVMFIGGVTYAEIAALRFLSTRPDLDCDFVIATTKLMNGTTLIEGYHCHLG